MVIPLPSELIKKEKLSQKVCQQYALDVYAENIIIIDTGEAKLMTPFFELASLRKIPGLENAKFLDPYAGGKANSVRYMSVGIRDEYMRAKGVDNLFLAGEKSGFFVGHTEAITTGTLAGYNAARLIRGKDMMTLPKELVTGQLLYFSAKVMGDDDCLHRRFTFAGGEFFERMKKKGLYLLEPKEIRKKVEELGLLNIYNKR